MTRYSLYHFSARRIFAYLSTMIFCPNSSKLMQAFKSAGDPVMLSITPNPNRLCSIRCPAFISRTDIGMKSASGVRELAELIFDTGGIRFTGAAATPDDCLSGEPAYGLR